MLPPRTRATSERPPPASLPGIPRSPTSSGGGCLSLYSSLWVASLWLMCLRRRPSTGLPRLPSVRRRVRVRPVTGEAAQNFAFILIDDCLELRSGSVSLSGLIAQDIADGAPPADAGAFNAYLQSTFCPEADNP